MVGKGAIMKLFRVIIPTEHLQNSILFYTDLFETTGRQVSDGRYYIQTENVILAIYSPIDDGDTLDNKWHFHNKQIYYFSTDDVEAIHQKCLNICPTNTVTDIQKKPWGELSFYCQDPNGVNLCFVKTSTEYTV